MKRLAAILVLGTIGLVSFLAHRRAEAGAETGAFSSSVIEADEVDVASRVGGRLLALEVREGASVDEGAVVARLDCAPLEAQRRELEAQRARAAAEARAISAQARGIDAQRRGAANQVRSARVRTEVLRTRRDVASREADRVRQLGEHASASQRDRVETEAESLRLELSARQREVQALQAQVRAADANEDATNVRAEAAGHAVEALEAGIARLELEIAECVVRAPRSGVVETLFFDVGELVPPGRPLVRLVDLEALEVTAYVTGDALAQVAAGADASVRVDAFPDEEFAGIVATVAVEAVFTPRNIQTRSDRDRLVYPVTITLENPEHRLVPGMPVEVRLGAE